MTVNELVAKQKLAAKVLPAQDRKGEGQQAGNNPENGHRQEVVAVSGGETLDEITAGHALQAGGGITGDAHDAQGRARSPAGYKVQGHETGHDAEHNAEGETEEGHKEHVRYKAAFQEKKTDHLFTAEKSGSPFSMI